MTDVILRISGMDCGACAVRIVRALQGLPGLREVSVSDTAGCACLTYDEVVTDLGAIARCVQRAGVDVPVGMAELRCPGADAGRGAPAGGVRRAVLCARGIPSR
ncbi:MAG: heavy-metal-associated domain-containing protein [Oscillospiraceae bacterium]